MSFAGLPMFGFDLVVADPPWLIELRSEAGEAKAPQAHYACMPIEAIKALRVGELVGADAFLFLWTSAPLLDRGIETLQAWGFTYKSRLTWRKVTKNGKVRVGPGYLVRTMSEDILVGTIGRPKLKHALPSIFDGLAREHSRKPDEFYKLIEGAAPRARRLDLFSRQSRPGWTTWGNEATKFDEGGDDAQHGRTSGGHVRQNCLSVGATGGEGFAACEVAQGDSGDKADPMFNLLL